MFEGWRMLDFSARHANHALARADAERRLDHIDGFDRVGA